MNKTLNNQPTTRKRVEIEQRRKIVAANLVSGLSYRALAEQLGCSIGTIANDAKAILKEYREQRERIADSSLNWELIRVDRLLNAVWAKALEGDKPALDVCLRLMERRAKLLGLDKQSVDLTSLGEQLNAGQVVLFLPDNGRDGAEAAHGAADGVPGKLG